MNQKLKNTYRLKIAGIFMLIGILVVVSGRLTSRKDTTHLQKRISMNHRLTVLIMSVLLLSFLVMGSLADFTTTPTSVEDEGGQNEEGIYWIHLASVADTVRGDEFILSSQTNLPVGEHIYLRIRQSDLHRTKTYDISEIQISENIEILPGISGINQTMKSIDTSGFEPGEYLIEEYGLEKKQGVSTLLFNVFPPKTQQYWMQIQPVGEWAVGEKRTIVSWTNLSVGQEVVCKIHLANYSLVRMGESYVERSIEVQKGDNNTNLTYCDVDISSFKPGEYIVIVSAKNKVSSDNRTFPVIIRNSSNQFPTPSQKTPLSAVVFFFGILGALLLISKKRR